MQPSDSTVHDLRHGVQLRVCDKTGKLTLRDVAAFLLGAARVFKYQIETVGVALYEEDEYVETKAGHPGRDQLLLSYVGRDKFERLSNAQWIDAVANAHASVASIQTMVEKLDTWRPTPEEHDGLLVTLAQLLRQPRGDLLAMAAMFKYQLSKDKERDRSKPQ